MEELEEVQPWWGSDRSEGGGRKSILGIMAYEMAGWAPN